MSTKRARDPVCGMEFDPELSDFATEHRGSTYYFCSPFCQDRFEEDPERYPAEPDPRSSDRP